MSNELSPGYVYLLRHKKLNMVKIGHTRATTPEQRLASYADSYQIPRNDIEVVKEWILPAPLVQAVETHTHALLSISQVQIAGAKGFFATSEDEAKRAVESAIIAVWAQLQAWKENRVDSEGNPLLDFDLTKKYTVDDDDTGELTDIVQFCERFVGLMFDPLKRDPSVRVTAAEYLLLQRMFSALRLACPDYYDINDALSAFEKEFFFKWETPRITAKPTDYLSERQKRNGPER